jgi:shikimate kinase
MSISNIILIGMPGAGKSTVGMILAGRLGLNFLDTDVVIQTRQGRSLQDIIDSEGLAAFRRTEERTLLELDGGGRVIATGGSAIYSEEGMAGLKRNGTVVFLNLPLHELRRRIKDMDTRGMVIDPGESFAELYRKRLPLYRRHADMTIDCRGKSAEEIAGEIAAILDGC